MRYFPFLFLKNLILILHRCPFPPSANLSPLKTHMLVYNQLGLCCNYRAHPEWLCKKHQLSQYLLMFAVTTWKALARCTSAALSFSFSLSGFWFIQPLWWPLASLTLMFLNNGEGGGHLMPLLSSTRLSFALLIFPNMLCSNVSFLLLSFPFLSSPTPVYSPPQPSGWCCPTRM